ncbi:hypothetical protein UR09_01815 [Candidatus Nitromaritima sp. SCGC AAA799-A02]|nr:hypothetical protein UR09_01815 [Candidatus Nitromaritima sp. SCGC AAA799-A02]
MMSLLKKYCPFKFKAFNRAWRGPLFLFIFLLAFIPGTASADSLPREYVIKAGFIYNFTKFISWPVGSGSETSFGFCVHGRDPFGSVLDELASVRKVNGKPLVIKRQTRITDLSSCHIIFIPQSKSSKLQEVIRAVKGFPVLIIGDSPGMARRGAGINLVILNNRIRFEINLDSISEAGLKISSELLDLGILVRGGK